MDLRGKKIELPKDDSHKRHDSTWVRLKLWFSVDLGAGSNNPHCPEMRATHLYEIYNVLKVYEPVFCHSKVLRS